MKTIVKWWDNNLEEEIVKDNEKNCYRVVRNGKKSRMYGKREILKEYEKLCNRGYGHLTILDSNELKKLFEKFF